MKMSKWQEIAQQVQGELDICGIALQEQVLGCVKWVRSGPYRVGALRLTGTHGGIVIIRWQCKGQSDTFRVALLDTEIEGMRKFCDESEEVRHLTKLLDMVRVMRQRELDKPTLVAFGK